MKDEMIQFRLDPPARALLFRLAQHNGTVASAVIRECIDQWLFKHRNQIRELELTDVERTYLDYALPLKRNNQESDDR